MLGLIGIGMSIAVIFLVVVMPLYNEAHTRELNLPLPAFNEFLLDISDTIRIHVVGAECVAFAFLVAGLATINCARLRRIRVGLDGSQVRLSK